MDRTTNITVDTRYLFECAQRLVSINSVNPDLTPGGAGESQVARATKELMEEMGMDVRVLENQEGRPSVLGRLPGHGQGRSLMLNAHFDTVGTEGMTDPFSARIEDGRLLGRGAYDMKGALASCLAAVQALTAADRRPAGDLYIAAVADEECASLGTSEVIGTCLTDAAVVVEPTQLEICTAHKGFIWLEVETLGRAYHGSRPDQGIDAIMRMGRFLSRLDLLEKELRRRPPHALLGTPSLHTGLIEGGTSESVYAASCRVKIERRTLPGETLQQILGEIEPLLEALREEDASFRANLRVLLERPAFEGDVEGPLMEALRRSCRSVLGETPRLRGEHPWMDSALLSDAGVETLVIGPIGAGAHSDDEWVDLNSLGSLAQIVAETALNYCR